MNAIRGVLHWLLGRVFCIDWCDRCYRLPHHPDSRHRRFTTDEILCYGCWRKSIGRAA